MSARYHLTALLPADPIERTHAVTKAFGMALDEAARSPDFRVQMIVGEAYQRYSEVVRWLAAEIKKESPATQEAFRAMVRTVPKSRYANHQAVHALLMADAETLLPDTGSCLSQE